MSESIETRSHSSVSVGDKLPALEIPLSTTLIVSTAIASGVMTRRVRVSAISSYIDLDFSTAASTSLTM